MNYEVSEIMSGNNGIILTDVNQIKDPIVRKATKGMADAIKAGQKSGWQFAYHAALVKEAFSPAKGIEVSKKLKEQFGSIKGYCEQTGVGASSLHNSAKALAFMAREHMVPSIMGKDGKTRIDFDRFTLNVGQAVELGAYTPEEFQKLKETCEQTGNDYHAWSSATLRKWRKEINNQLTDGRHSDKTEEEATEEVAKEAKEAKTTKEVTKEEAIAIIKKLMAEHGITIEELQVG
jgi:hypothetical protein